MEQVEPDTEELIRQALTGGHAARGALLQRHRARLRRMVELRMDPRLTARVDPSDIVQDALAEADTRLDIYMRDKPLPFYPWLRQIAWDRLADAHRRHVRAARRSVTREHMDPFRLPDNSALELASRLVGTGAGPSELARREEHRVLVRAALERLSERDRELLVLRHLEQMAVKEIAAVLGVSEGAVKTRTLRALQRLRTLLGKDLSEEQ
jgi:RNA polymerase sigma-70 factor (ECF subfamily)